VFQNLFTFCSLLFTVLHWGVDGSKHHYKLKERRHDHNKLLNRTWQTRDLLLVSYPVVLTLVVVYPDLSLRN